MNSFKSKKDWVYGMLHRAILNGELPPRARIIIEDWAEKYGVSQIPVREALLQLQADGLINIQPYMGAKVIDLNEGLVQEIFEILEALEITGVRIASQKIEDEGYQRLEEQLKLMDGICKQPEQWAQENINFHRLISEQANALLTARMMKIVQAHLERLKNLHGLETTAGEQELMQQEHWAILDALRLHNTQVAESIIRAHLTRSREYYLTRINGQTGVRYPHAPNC